MYLFIWQSGTCIISHSETVHHSNQSCLTLYCWPLASNKHVYSRTMEINATIVKNSYQVVLSKYTLFTTLANGVKGVGKSCQPHN